MSFDVVALFLWDYANSNFGVRLQFSRLLHEVMNSTLNLLLEACQMIWQELLGKKARTSSVFTQQLFCFYGVHDD